MNKNNSFYFLLLTLFLSTTVTAADMSERQPGAAGSRMGSTQTSHMMIHEMTHEMSKMMQQMTIMMRDMNRIMEKKATMDKTRVQEMARVMEQLSQAMHNMSQHMAAGDLDKNMLRETEQHMNNISNMIQTMEQNKK